MRDTRCAHSPAGRAVSYVNKRAFSTFVHVFNLKMKKTEKNVAYFSSAPVCDARFTPPPFLENRSCFDLFLKI